MIAPADHRETSEAYSGVIARLTDRHRVIICKDGIQWIVQRRDAEGLAGGRWRALGYCTTRKGLIRLCGTFCEPPEAIRSMPEHIGLVDAPTRGREVPA